MTAEVVILNKSAAVLAADSAVTIQTRQTRKTYNSASKIAMLSRDPPVGAIAYGQADLLGVPWESVERMYRDHLLSQDSAARTHVADIAAGFFQWLDYNGEWLFGAASTARAVRLASASLDELLHSLRSLPNEASLNLDGAARAYIRTRLSAILPIDDIEQQQEATLRHHRQILDGIIDNHAISSLQLQRATWAEVGKFLANAICQDALAADAQETGIAFAGVGDREYHPTLVVYKINGVLNNCTVRSERVITRRVSGDRPAHIEPLGQTAAIEALLQGVHPNYQKRIDEVLERLGGRLSRMVEEFLISKNVDVSEHVPAMTEAMDFLIERSLGQLLDIRNNNPLPMLEMIADLPTPELVNAAESLVLLTALQQRVGPETETVGLPVDVAVASRSDGFVWVRRKRYYRAEMNQRADEM